MKYKSLFTSILSLIILFYSCKKEDTKSPSTGQSGGNFVLNNVSYNVTSASKLTTNITSYSFNSYNKQTFLNSAINFYFAGTNTPVSGTYTLVPSTANIGPNQVYVLATNENGTGFESVNVVSTITVTVSGNQVDFKMNNTNLTETGGVNIIQASANTFIKL